MILDNIQNLALYTGVHPHVQRCIEFLAQTDLEGLTPGKYELVGRDLYYSVSEYETKAPNLFEAHDQYADLQYILVGNERIDYAPRAACKQEGEYNDVKDVVFFSAEKFSPLKLKQGDFAIFFPDDCHRPNVTDGEISKNKKIVFKIKL